MVLAGATQINEVLIVSPNTDLLPFAFDLDG
jgi:hypothetical protein